MRNTIDLGERFIMYRRGIDEDGAVCVEFGSADHLAPEQENTTPAENEASTLIFRLRTKKPEVIDSIISQFLLAKVELLKK
jgi:hypothetical protein